jgi:glucose/arabinose dehydrogenase
MKFQSITGSLILSLISAGAALAQEAQPAAPAETKPSEVASTPAKPAEKLVLKEGSDVNLKFAQDLSSKTATEDDPVNLVLDQDLKIGDVVIAKAGAKAVGTITHAKKAGMMGKAGELNMRLQYLLVGDTRVKLRGTKGKEGQGKEGTAVALTVLFGPIGLIKHGKNVDIKEGTPLLAYTDENYELPASK